MSVVREEKRKRRKVSVGEREQLSDNRDASQRKTATERNNEKQRRNVVEQKGEKT